MRKNALALLIVLAAPAARAQNERPPSEQLAQALRLYEQESYSRAAIVFEDVRAGRTADSPRSRQRADFFLGKCLYHLQRYREALAVLERTSQPGHEYFRATLTWLGRLWTHQAESPAIVDAVGRYRTEQLEGYNNREQHSLYVRLSYLMGRARFAQQRYEEARDLLARAIDAPDVGRDAQVWHHRVMATLGPM